MHGGDALPRNTYPSLTTHLIDLVPKKVQNKGRSYFWSGAVRVVDGDATYVDARVRGSEMYDVLLERQGTSVLVSCTCPYFQGNVQTCKHIWATLLAAETKGYLQGDGETDLLDIVEDEEALEDDDDPGQDYYDEWQEDDVYDEGSDHGVIPFRRASGQDRKNPSRAGDWKRQLARLRPEAPSPYSAPPARWPAGREVLYVVDVPATLSGHQGLVIDVAYRERKKDGNWGKPKSSRIGLDQVTSLPDPADRHVLALLVGARDSSYGSYGWDSYGYGSYGSVPPHCVLSQPMQEAMLPLMCATGRCFLRPMEPEAELRPLRWEDGPPWEFWLVVRPDEAGKNYEVKGELRRGDVRLPLAAPAMLVAGGLVFGDGWVARLQDFGAFGWVSLLREHQALAVPIGQRDDLLRELLKLPRLPRLDLPEDIRFEEVSVPPKPRLRIKKADRSSYDTRLAGELTFDYGGEIVKHNQPGRAVYQPEGRRLILRDPDAELAAEATLRQVGLQSYGYDAGLYLAARNLPRVVRTLLAAGWHVEADGKLYRQPGAFKIEVNSGIDWFELHGSVQFGDSVTQLPELLAALKRGEDTVRLGDGTFGILPQEWLQKYGVLAGLGTAEGDHLRFSKSQVGLLDALLSAQPEATCDEVFNRARDELRRFQGVEAVDPPAGFVGQLRPYQREGLGWLHFLQKFGFGGCLADDMGLGKTVQVLALLESRRELRAKAAGNGTGDRPRPSLVVVPKSLVFNWKQEAARFAPSLRVLDHTGLGRPKTGEGFEDHDLVLTTYGTLRRDVLLFKDVTFDYCILDEAQAIKNASTESAKAARLLRGNHRLVLSGTPVENHLGELWSLFEFLNPGMLGAASVFRLGGAGARNPSEETRTLLARALRPFILRRTKDQVARDLPARLEQTLYCELEGAQRKQYDELRDHYRRALLGRIERDGINKAKMQILEALLRLRQAACHPGLIDKKKTREASAKLDMLLPQVQEVLDEGHKVLVFSQFTSLLAIVRDRLDKEKILYEYLDGRTRDRAARVERFQNDPDCKLFLISLKAGGLGLNLTAAEYVYLLDPWWNPAVEAQAIDRAHRIGQTRQVFAYRLIAKDTVEEKVLELQKSKRDLADAIINADNSLIRKLGREDLELLLS